MVKELNPDLGDAWQSPLLLRSEEHTSELQSRRDLVCRLLLEKKRTALDVACTHPSYRCSITVSCIRETGVTKCLMCFFFNDPATTEIYPLSLHAALPI